MPQHTVRFITRNFGRYDTSSLASYESIGGFSALKKAVCLPREDIVEIISQAHVKGRGGAGYDMGRKWRQAREVPGPDKVIVCNADEGEPGTFKDRALLENDPFLVVEAMILAGYTMEAENGYIYLREEYSHLRPSCCTPSPRHSKRGISGKISWAKGSPTICTCIPVQAHMYAAKAPPWSNPWPERAGGPVSSPRLSSSAACSDAPPV